MLGNSTPNYGLLTQGVPQMNIVSPMAGALTGINAASNNRLQAAQGQQAQASAQNTQLQTQIQKLGTLRDSMAGVVFSPPEKQGEAYNAALKTMKVSGMDTSGLPSQWGPDAQAYVSNSYYSSGMSLERAKAQAQIMASQAAMGENVARSNFYQFQQGQPPIFGNQPGQVGSQPNSGQTQGAPGGGTPVPGSGNFGMGTPSPWSQNAVTQPQGGTPVQSVGGNQPGQISPQQGTAPENGITPNIGSPGQQVTPPQTGNTVRNPMNGQPESIPQPLQQYTNKQYAYGPAGIQMQKEEYKQLVDYNGQLADAQTGARETLPFLKSARDKVEQLGKTGQGPIVGDVTGKFGVGNELTKDNANLQFALIRSMKGLGNRVMATEFTTAAKAMPDPHNTMSTNLHIIDQKEAVVKFAQLDSQAAQMLEQYGMKNKQDITSILDKVYQQLDVYDPKTGEVHKDNLDDYWKTFSSISGIKLGQDYQTGSGRSVSENQIYERASQHNISPQDVINYYKLSPKGQTQSQTQQPTAMNSVSPQPQNQLAMKTNEDQPNIPAQNIPNYQKGSIPGQPQNIPSQGPISQPNANEGLASKALNAINPVGTANASSLASLPRGLRNNNPGNLEKTSMTMPGETQGTDPRFKTFQTPAAGIAAIGKLLDRYASNGKLTINSIVNKYAPPNENDTSAYASKLAKTLGVSPTDKIDVTNPHVKGALVKTIIQIENGKVPYSDQYIGQALNGSI